MFYILYGDDSRYFEYKKIISQFKKENMLFFDGNFEIEDFFNNLFQTSITKKILILFRGEKLKSFDFLKNNYLFDVLIDVDSFNIKSFKSDNVIFFCASDKYNQKKISYIAEKLSISYYESKKIFEKFILKNSVFVYNEVEKLINCDKTSFENLISKKNTFNSFEILDNIFNIKIKNIDNYFQIFNILQNIFNILYISRLVFKKTFYYYSEFQKEFSNYKNLFSNHPFFIFKSILKFKNISNIEFIMKKFIFINNEIEYGSLSYYDGLNYILSLIQLSNQN